MFDLKAFLDLVDPSQNIIVAFSGGGDSSALLHFCHELNLQQHLHASLSAIHVNHSLNKNSDLWEDHCRKFCKDRNIPFQSYVVTINKKNLVLNQLQEMQDIIFLKKSFKKMISY